ncbi:MAG: thioredoxin family protein [Planctomycetota bacterium]
MDRSFLSNEKVIEASRRFVCIRLATYEDDAEAEFLKTIYVGNTGALENTVFVLLSPDGDENLCRPGRSPQFAFRSPEQMALEMGKIADKYDAKTITPSKHRLPEMKNVRLGVNVGACDGIPSIICYSNDDDELNQMKSRLAPLALSDDLAGKFVYASSNKATELSMLKGTKKKSAGFYVVTPDEYGLAGKIQEVLDADSNEDALKKALVEIAENTAKSKKDHNSHVRTGKRSGKSWETEIPVTDPMSLRAMGRRGGRN